MGNKNLLFDDVDIDDKDDDDFVLEEEIDEENKKRKKKKRKRTIFVHQDIDNEDIQINEADEEKDSEETSKDSYQQLLDKMENICARIENGEVSEITAFDDKMKPLIKKDFSKLLLVRFNLLSIGDIVLHNSKYDGYSVRRVIKSKGDSIYLLGDREKKYFIIDRNMIIAKVAAKIENGVYTSFNLSNHAHYKNKMVSTAKFRTLGRIYKQLTDEEYNIFINQKREEEINNIKKQDILTKEAKQIENSKKLKQDVAKFDSISNTENTTSSSKDLNTDNEQNPMGFYTNSSFEDDVSKDRIDNQQASQDNSGSNKYSDLGFQTSSNDGFSSYNINQYESSDSHTDSQDSNYDSNVAGFQTNSNEQKEKNFDFVEKKEIEQGDRDIQDFGYDSTISGFQTSVDEDIKTIQDSKMMDESEIKKHKKKKK